RRDIGSLAKGHMTFSATELKLVLAEITPALIQGWIQKIYQPGARVVVFELRVRGATHRLLVSCEPETARLHLARHRSRNPPSPPPFCQFLRAHLEGARLCGMHQLGEDRVVTMEFTTKSGSRTVVCELTGHAANILVLDEHQHVLRDLNHQRDRIGQQYQPPASHPSALDEKVVAFDSAKTEDHRFPVSAAIEAYYRDNETRAACDRGRLEELRSLRKAIKKTRRRIDAWREDLAKATRYRDYARYGNLMKANLRSIMPANDQVTLVDYYDESLPEVTIPLDRSKSAIGNMGDYFKKHRKYLAAERELVPRIAQAEDELNALEREIASIEQGTRTPSGEGRPARWNPVTKRSTSGRARGPFRRFTSSDGLPIFVGRNAQENDQLTFGLANNEDLWLHARGAPGSHVVVRLSKGSDPPPETLRDAATLALLYSDLKKSGKGEIVYTKRKWVKPAKRRALGSVIVSQEKTIYVQLDRKRLEALKAGQLRSPS
ncbi:MAG TPA: NFACT family protein, partial [Nitrospira sp.]|nr:NFACT family protein [Nitrospira sp.]